MAEEAFRHEEVPKKPQAKPALEVPIQRTELAGLTRAAQVRTEREAYRVFDTSGKMFEKDLNSNPQAKKSELGRIILE